MPQKWSRRTLLATLGGAAFAGCSRSSENSPASPTPTDVPKRTPTPPDSVTADWPLPAHDPGRSNYAPESAGPRERVAGLWHVEASAALSAPVVADGTVFVGCDDGAVRAFDVHTGEEHWRRSVGGTAGTPRVVNGTAYVPAGRAIHALSPDDGTETWTVETGPLRDLVVASHGLYYLTGGEPTVVALDSDGTERWETSIEDPWEPTVFAGPEQVFVPTGASNPQPWKLTAETGEVRNDHRPMRGADSPETRFCRDGTLFAIDGFFGNVEANPAATDGMDWRYSVDGAGKFALAGGTDRLYLTHMDYSSPGGRLFTLSMPGATFAWEATDLSGCVGRPIVASESVLVRTDKGLRCFDPAEGSERWTYRGDFGDNVLLVDDIVVTTVGSTLRALQPP